MEEGEEVSRAIFPPVPLGAAQLAAVLHGGLRAPLHGQSKERAVGDDRHLGGEAIRLPEEIFTLRRADNRQERICLTRCIEDRGR